MANIITTRIALEGGREIIQALKQLGDEGAKAFKEIQASADKFVGPPPQLTTNLASISKGIQSMGVGLVDVGSKIRSAGQTFSLLGIAVGGAATAFGFLAKSGADAADQMDKAAQKAGLSIEEFGKLSFAAEQNDVAVEDFTTAMGRLNKQIDAAVKGSGAAVSLFDRVGVSLADLSNQSPDEIFLDLVDAFSKMEDGAQKSALAIQFFGRGGIQLIPLLNQTRDGVAALGEEFTRLGLGFTEEQARIGDEFGDTLNLLGRAIGALKNQIGLVFVPALNAAAQAIIDFIANNRESIIGFFEGLRDFFANLPAPIQQFIAALGGITIVLGPVLIALGLFVQVLGFALGGIGTLLAGLVKLGGFLTGGTLITGLRSIVQVVTLLIGVLGAWGIALAVVGAAVVALAILVVRNWDDIKKAVKSAIAAVLRYFADLVGSAARAAEAITDAFVGAFTSIWESAKSIFADILQWLSDVIANATRAAQAITGVGQGAAEGGGFARGGKVTGPGTSTSDSIPAWLSTGEFVIQAKAVRKYGRALFENLNSMRLTRDGGGFNMGGFVEGLTTSLRRSSFAMGGLAPSGPTTTVNLHLDGQQFALSGKTDVVDQLVSSMQRRNLASAGRTPGQSR